MTEARTRICTVIGRTRHRMVVAEMNEAVKQGADLIEIRLDFIARAPDFKLLLAERKCELVATVRRREDGGRWPGTEDARQMLLRQCIVDGFDWVDLETDVADKIRRFKNVKRIVSYHNTKMIPDNLEEIFEQMLQQDADVYKVAVTGKTLSDNRRLLDLVKGAPKPTVGVCMGDLGRPSRLLGPKCGAPFVYAAFNADRVPAPGMPSFAELKRAIPVERLGPNTQVYAVIGDPVGHSLSPLVHNAAFKCSNINAFYLPIWVPKGHVPECLTAFSGLIDGYSVTIPHKEPAAHVADSRDPSVDVIHAANTLVRAEKGYRAFNTDSQALTDTLYARLPAQPDGKPFDFHKIPVLILGAGGVARAAAHILHKLGCTIWIANRTPDRGHKLADEIHGEYLDWQARHKEGCRIVINCTSIGMHPNVDESPLHISYLKPGLLVFDTVYTPETTMLVRQARSCDCDVVTGVEMFVRQAGLQFKHFTGQEPPIESMLQAMRRALSPIRPLDGE